MTDKETRNYGSHLLINLASRRLSYYAGDRPIKDYPVGVGKQSTPTPTGKYAVADKIMHPGGALGTRWMGLSIPGGRYGIHGTNNPASIGGYVSNGCIRMHNHNVEEIFPKVQIGTPVIIISGREAGPPPGTPAAGTPAAGSNPAGKKPVKEGGSLVHIVQPGESLWQIARKYGKDLKAIIRVNNIANPDLIYPGQSVIIPSGS